MMKLETKQIRLQLSAESFDCEVGPTDICWQTVPESWSGGSECTIAKPCACGNARTGVVVWRPELAPTGVANKPAVLRQVFWCSIVQCLVHQKESIQIISISQRGLKILSTV